MESLLLLKDELCLSYEALLFLYHSDDYEISKVSQMNAQIRKWNEVSSFSPKTLVQSGLRLPESRIQMVILSEFRMRETAIIEETHPTLCLHLVTVNISAGYKPL